MLPPLPLSLFLFMRAWRRKEEGVERISICGCVPLCLRPMCGSFRVRSSRVDISVVPGSLHRYPVNPPRRQEHCCGLATSRLGQRRGDTTRKEVQTSVGHYRMWRSSHTCTRSHLSTLCPRREANRLLVLFERRRGGSTSIQHELIITSLSGRLQRSRYTPSLESTCVRACVRMSDIPLRLLLCSISRTPTCRSHLTHREPSVKSLSARSLLLHLGLWTSG